MAEPVMIGTGVAAAWHPNGTEANVFYVGASDQIYNWFWNGSTWAKLTPSAIPWKRGVFPLADSRKLSRARLCLCRTGPGRKAPCSR